MRYVRTAQAEKTKKTTIVESQSLTWLGRLSCNAGKESWISIANRRRFGCLARAFYAAGLWIGVDSVGSTQRNSKNLSFNAAYPRRSLTLFVSDSPTIVPSECYIAWAGIDCAQLLNM
jgi:hypothetical protein